MPMVQMVSPKGHPPKNPEHLWNIPCLFFSGSISAKYGLHESCWMLIRFAPRKSLQTGDLNIKILISKNLTRLPDSAATTIARPF